MNEILGKAKTIRELFSGAKYAIDYYQREYKWQAKHVQELIEDLTNKFLEHHEPHNAREDVEMYGHYFLGAMIISRKDNSNYIIDGQQRLTTLTLLLIYLHNLQNGRSDAVKIDDLILSEKYGRRTFNIHVDERISCMEMLFEGQSIDETDQPESVQNILGRYENISEFFPEELTQAALPFFIDWLIDNVHLVEITAFSDDDAYTIFETMNDRGLSLSPTDMLKGFLLANISHNQEKTRASDLWKQRITELTQLGKDFDADCFKVWLRSQYAETIRERKKGARAEEFDRIGTEFHRFVRDYRERLGLVDSTAYLSFIERDFNFYARQYIRLIKATQQITPGMEFVFYNAQHGFTLQYMVMLAPLTPDDPQSVVDRKIQLVSRYIDILLNRRLWNFRSIAYSTMQYAMFIVMREIRGASVEILHEKLHRRLNEEDEVFSTNDRLYMHQQNRKYLHRILARITDYIEQESGMPSRYLEYTTGSGSKRYEVEHIWANKPERHTDEFPHPTDFIDYRNRLGGLLLLPKRFNASYGDLHYVEKLDHYNAQNLLARTLHPNCYEHNPGFLNFIKQSGLPFQDHKEFHKTDLDQRQQLYRLIAEQIWDPAKLDQEHNQ